MSSVINRPAVNSFEFDLEFPACMQFLFQPKRYKVVHGGRGSAKSWSVARALLSLAGRSKLRILCTRETQTSITESVHRLLKEQIDALPGLGKIFEVQNSVIRCTNGSEFIFLGVKTDPAKIKSTEGVDICWVEEAEKVSEYSWTVLIPTVRKPGSEIWVSFNPNEETDPTAKRFLLNPPPDAIVREVNWSDNPWFPEVLAKEKDYLYRVDPDAAAHVWGGQFRKGSEAKIFQGKYVVEGFEAEIKNTAGELVPKPGWMGPYFGADWGFARDPITLVKVWKHQARLYLEYEAYGIGVELNQIPEFFASVPGSKRHIIRGDPSRPETIFHLNGLGLNVVAAQNWPGAVEDGIAWLRMHEMIVIHPRCKHAEEEARLYRYKVDPVTGDVLPIIVGKHDHIWDGVRYAMEPAIRTAEQEMFHEHLEEVMISPELDDFDRYSDNL